MFQRFPLVKHHLFGGNTMYDPLPNTGFLRLPQILGDKKANPPIPALYPVSKSNWWAGVKSGRYPKPVKLSVRCTAWRVEDIRKLIETLGEVA